MSPAAEQTTSVPLSDGAEILLRRTGHAGGARLFLSHGNGFAIDGYRDFWEPLAARFELLLFDMRNHGRNPPAGGDGHHYRQLARDLEAVAVAARGAFGDKPGIGVFHSMSARAALKQAVEGPRLWAGLALYDPPSVPPPAHPLYEAMRAFEIKLVSFALDRPARFTDPDQLAAQFATGRAQSRWTPRSRVEMARAILRPDGADWTLRCPRELEAAIYLQALNLDLWPAAADAPLPVKIIGADPELEGTGPTGRANAALSAEGGFAYEAVAGTGHLLQIERPEACRAALVRWLESLGLA
ncbi:alpha/beta hydrolase [Xanthobacter sp. V4C-4]|uniref:alpha/beta fold hydrolase n=1 Tax=Xanthobacter cornucopiae TaxID=3119924 RepID=UPI0037287B30